MAGRGTDARGCLPYSNAYSNAAKFGGRMWVFPPTPFGRAGERRKTRVVNYSRQLRVLPLTIER